jgi:hypothetical protein
MDKGRIIQIIAAHTELLVGRRKCIALVVKTVYPASIDGVLFEPDWSGGGNVPAETQNSLAHPRKNDLMSRLSIKRDSPTQFTFYVRRLDAR